MKKSTKVTLALGTLLSAVFVATSCTSNFCTNVEKSRMLFAIEPGVSTYFNSEEEAKANQKEGYTYTFEQVFSDNSTLWRRVEVNDKGAYTKSLKLSSIIEAAKKSNYAVPTTKYFTTFDTKVLELATYYAGASYSTSTLNAESAMSVLKNFGYMKFYSSVTEEGSKEKDKIWVNFESINSKVCYEVGIEQGPSIDFYNLYQSNMNSSVNNARSCIATIEGEYGNYGQKDESTGRATSVTISRKDWGYAWSKGPVSGLIVYPVAWLVDTFSNSFAGGINSSAMYNGWPQLLALVLVTVIVRLFIFAVTFKSVLSQQKMQALQPELAKIQAKYPNSNTNQAQKQRMAEEQMRLYKKNKVNPLSQLLVLLVQFPIFIGVWGAMTGSAVLSTGSFLHLNLATSIWDALRNMDGMPSNINGWWTALVLFLLMAIAQFMAMKVPQWITKAKTKKIARLGKNPAQTQQNRTMNIVSYVMLAMIIFMGFTLPAAMGVYWFIGALVSLAQSLITQLIVGRKRHK